MRPCPNCASPILDTDDYCPLCEFRRQELVERLLEPGDNEPSMAVRAGWVVFGRRRRPERVWWVG